MEFQEFKGEGLLPQEKALPEGGDGAPEPPDGQTLRSSSSTTASSSPSTVIQGVNIVSEPLNLHQFKIMQLTRYMFLATAIFGNLGFEFENMRTYWQ